MEPSISPRVHSPLPLCPLQSIYEDKVQQQRRTALSPSSCKILHKSLRLLLLQEQLITLLAHKELH